MDHGILLFLIKKLSKNKHMEVVADTKVITIHMKCDGCGKGYMLNDGEMLLDHGMMVPLQHDINTDVINVEMLSIIQDVIRYINMSSWKILER